MRALCNLSISPHTFVLPEEVILSFFAADPKGAYLSSLSGQKQRRCRSCIAHQENNFSVFIFGICRRCKASAQMSTRNASGENPYGEAAQHIVT